MILLEIMDADLLSMCPVEAALQDFKSCEVSLQLDLRESGCILTISTSTLTPTKFKVLSGTQISLEETN